MNRSGQAGTAGPAGGAPLSVDAKLAAQAAAATASSTSNATTTTRTTQQAQLPSAQSQQAPPSAPSAAAAARSSKKEEHLLLSLPSRDSGLHHVRPWDHGDEAGEYDESTEDGDFLGHTTYPRLTNRGHKLAPGARSVRKGRLGGWDSYEAAAPAPRISSPGLGDSTSAAGTSSATTANGNGNAAKYGGPGTGAAQKKAPPPHGTFEHNTLLYADEIRRHQLPSGLPAGKDVYPLTPNLTFVPSSSTAAARPDREPPAYSFLPGPNSPTSPSALSPRKRKKIYSAYTGLASTSGSTSNHTSAPVRAYLPVPPQNPIELVMSPLVTRTFSPRNNTLEKLSLHATDLIERDMPLVRALTRVVDALRGNAIPGNDGVLGLPFSGDDEQLVLPEDKKLDDDDVGADASGTDKEAAEETAASSSADASMQADAEQNVAKQEKESESAPKANGDAEGSDQPSSKRRRTASPQDMEVDEVKKETAAMETTSAKGKDTALISGTSVDTAVGAVTIAAAETAEDKETAAEVVNGAADASAGDDKTAPADPLKEAAEASTDVTDEKTAEKAMATNEAVHDKVEAKEAVNTNDVEMASSTLDVPEADTNGATESRTGTPASFAPARGPGGGETVAEDDNESIAGSAIQDGEGASSKKPRKAKAMTRLSSTVHRIANPAPALHALLISQNSVKVPVPPGVPGSASAAANAAAGLPSHPPYNWHDLLLPGGNATIVTEGPEAPPQASTSAVAAGQEQAATTSAPTPTTVGTAPGTAGTRASTLPGLDYRLLSPAEQEETVNLCIQELTKFLSDTLEYRDRLGEIRDSILGVEKRRKGVWTMARSYAHQLLWEEEQDRLAQGM